MAKKNTNESLGDMAHLAEKDHEVQMARAELYKIAKYAIKLHDIMKGMDPTTDLESWVQASITKSAEHMDSVFTHLEYESLAATEKTQALESARRARTASGDIYKDSIKADLEEAKKKKMGSVPASRSPVAAAMKLNPKGAGSAGPIPNKKKNADKKSARGKVNMETVKK